MHYGSNYLLLSAFWFLTIDDKAAMLNLQTRVLKKNVKGDNFGLEEAFHVVEFAGNTLPRDPFGMMDCHSVHCNAHTRPSVMFA